MMNGTASIKYLRVWEVNRDGSIAGLTATAVDIDQHAPTHMTLHAAARWNLEHDELVLYGELVHRNLFSRSHAYGLEIWGGMVRLGPRATAPEPVSDEWGYAVFPLARPKDDDPDVDEDTLEYAYPQYIDNDGNSVDAVRFDLYKGNAWGSGPHPVRFTEHDGTLHPAHLEYPIASEMAFMFTTTTMNPTAALQYTEHITHREGADTWPT